MLDFIQDFDIMADKILIIDDDVDTLRLVGLMLQRQGYQISAATNGEQGLAKACDDARHGWLRSHTTAKKKPNHTIHTHFDVYRQDPA
jgi:DNA-binding response OmpR family regulator